MELQSKKSETAITSLFILFVAFQRLKPALTLCKILVLCMYFMNMKEKTLTVEDFSSICRICMKNVLYSHVCAYNIHCTLYCDEAVSDILSKCASVQVGNW